MSSHLNWMIIRDNNAFLLKKRNINKPFSTEANNLTNLSSYRYSGLVHLNKPAKANVKSTMKAGARRSLHKLKTLLKKNKYRVDLTKVCKL
ncbi:60S ribosomal protein L28 [Trachymyrmex zeteki]|uniref:Large ribosomal subunit protein eL28 n=1 Tax=Mycetomoellerius zeteki TaxID=64791 RepID=A0A151XBL0_9HYME|nr:60S ribosomal protein L28 [Trachymyrmex zeteki]